MTLSFSIDPFYTDCGFTLENNTGSSPERFEKIYQLLLDEAREENTNIKLVICEPFALPSGMRKADYDDWRRVLAPLQEKTRVIAERNGTVFVPLQDKFLELSKERSGILDLGRSSPYRMRAPDYCGTVA